MQALRQALVPKAGRFPAWPIDPRLDSGDSSAQQEWTSSTHGNQRPSKPAACAVARTVAGHDPLLYSRTRASARGQVRKVSDAGFSQGHVAEWLRNGLQNRVLRFNSGRGLQSTFPHEFTGWLIAAAFALWLSPIARSVLAEASCRFASSRVLQAGEWPDRDKARASPSDPDCCHATKYCCHAVIIDDCCGIPAYITKQNHF
jgi:hypothetical protein